MIWRRKKRCGRGDSKEGNGGKKIYEGNGKEKMMGKNDEKITMKKIAMMKVLGKSRKE